MEAANFATEEFPWEIISEDDFICRKNDYTLRVEQMYKAFWWFRVYHKEEIIPVEREYSPSKYRAIGMCEGLYLAFSLSQEKN